MEDQPANGQSAHEDDDEPSTTEAQPEFDRFKDLTDKLLKVPKAELNDKLEAVKAERSAPRK